VVNTLFHSCELLKIELSSIHLNNNHHHQEIRFLGVQLKATYELADAAAMFLQSPSHDLRYALSCVKHMYKALENYIDHVDDIIDEYHSVS
jgi:hypothetical protein